MCECTQEQKFGVGTRGRIHIDTIPTYDMNFILTYCKTVLNLAYMHSRG